MIRCLVSALLALLVGCQPAFVNGIPNENSPRFEVPVGAKFVLQSEIIVPPRTDRLYFQDGDLPAWYNVNKYQPYCVLRVAAPSERVRTIRPDTFVVTKVATAHFFQLIKAPGPTPPVRLASARAAVMLVDDNDASGGDDNYEVFGSVMHLRSPRQPLVTQLTCADWGQPEPGSHVTVREIRRSLGSYFHLELATK